MRRSIMKLYRLDGMKGFYRGLTASYAGGAIVYYFDDCWFCSCVCLTTVTDCSSCLNLGSGSVRLLFMFIYVCVWLD